MWLRGYPPPEQPAALPIAPEPASTPPKLRAVRHAHADAVTPPGAPANPVASTDDATSHRSTGALRHPLLLQAPESSPDRPHEFSFGILGLRHPLDSVLHHNSEELRRCHSVHCGQGSKRLPLCRTDIDSDQGRWSHPRGIRVPRASPRPDPLPRGALGRAPWTGKTAGPPLVRVGEIRLSSSLFQARCVPHSVHCITKSWVVLHSPNVERETLDPQGYVYMRRPSARPKPGRATRQLEAWRGDPCLSLRAPAAGPGGSLAQYDHCLYGRPPSSVGSCRRGARRRELHYQNRSRRTHRQLQQTGLARA
jgi:hypothetical protein